VLPVSDLRALAEGVRLARSSGGDARVDGWLLACMDARMGEVYWGVFEDRGDPVGSARGGERLSAPAGVGPELASLLPERARLLGAAGMGLGAYPGLVTELDLPLERCLAAAEPCAAQVAQLAAWDLSRGASWLDPAAAQPVYLRDRVVQAPL
jgi:tRNA threonylcarbamoyladenosine biosynthesis protein TsaB